MHNNTILTDKLFSRKSILFPRDLTMGTDAHVYIFNHRKYINEIVPAIKNMLLTGAASKLPAQAISDLNTMSQTEQLSSGTHIDQDCTYLEPDLSHIPENHNQDRPWNCRYCLSKGCNSKNTCPFHKENSDELLELLTVFQKTIISKTLGQSQFMGRNATTSSFSEHIDNAYNPELTNLMKKLGARGWIIGYSFAQVRAGIHGWLTPQETEQLALHLHQLPLPEYEQTLNTMRAFNTTPKDFSERQLTLSFLRTMAKIAAKDGYGILWGNDLW